MTAALAGGGHVERGGSGSLVDVVALILEKGLVIDVFVRVSVIGIELLTIDVRIIVASVDTFLRFAEATNRLDLHGEQQSATGLADLPHDLVHSGAKGLTSGVLDAVVDEVDAFIGGRRRPRAAERSARRDLDRSSS